MHSEGLNTFRAEEIGGGDPAEVAPVLAEGGEAHGAVEEELVGRLLDWTVGEGGAVEDLLGGFGLARDDETGETDRESHQVESFQGLCEAREGLVGGGGGEGEEDAAGAGNRAAVGPREGPGHTTRGEKEEADDEQRNEEQRR